MYVSEKNASPCISADGHDSGLEPVHAGCLRVSATGSFRADAELLIERLAFQSLALSEVVSFTTIHNRRSRAVMERLGMQESGILEHPQVPETPCGYIACTVFLVTAMPLGMISPIGS